MKTIRELEKAIKVAIERAVKRGDFVTPDMFFDKPADKKGPCELCALGAYAYSELKSSPSYFDPLVTITDKTGRGRAWVWAFSAGFSGDRLNYYHCSEGNVSKEIGAYRLGLRVRKWALLRGYLG